MIQRLSSLLLTPRIPVHPPVRLCLRFKSYVLGIESTFDDTGASVVSGDGEILSDVILSQDETHIPYKGIYPPKAGQQHEKNLPIAVDEAVAKSAIGWQDLSAVAVAAGPGLAMCLEPGVRYAKMLCKEHQLPLIAVNHLEAHIQFLRQENSFEYPFVCLLITGKNTQLLLVEDIGSYSLLGSTRDIGIGGCFDKIARALEPEKFQTNAGKLVEDFATKGDPKSFNFTIPMLRVPGCDLSFSGLKSQVLTTITKLKKYGRFDEKKYDIAASFQHIALKHVLHRTHRAMLWTKINNLNTKQLVICGGVARNKRFQNGLGVLARSSNMSLVLPSSPRFCTDNGVMIAYTGMLKYELGHVDSPDIDFAVDWPLGVKVDVVSDLKRHKNKKKERKEQRRQKKSQQVAIQSQKWGD